LRTKSQSKLSATISLYQNLISSHLVSLLKNSMWEATPPN